MTAINIFLQRRRAIITTDSLMIDFRTGLPAWLQDKCYAVPGSSMVVAARGDWRVPQWIADEIPRFYGDIDQVLADEAQAIRDLYDLWIADNEGNVYSAVVNIMIVGWSQSKNRPRGVVLAFNGTWTTVEIGPSGVGGPLLNETELERLRVLGVEPGVNWDLETLDPERHMIPYMEAQRRMRHPTFVNEDIEAHIVGGHILLTEITSKGVVQRIIHTWPDEPGEPIKVEPFSGPQKNVSTPSANMNRQQRRAWERKHGKATV